MTNIGISAIIPVYNDRAALEIAIPRSIEILHSISSNFELIIAEDGSTDGSADLVKGYEANNPHIHLVHHNERLGRGKALSRTIEQAAAKIVCYYDVDLATDMNHLVELITAINDGYDIASGSRFLPKSRVIRSGRRELLSRIYNWLVRKILGSTLYDHQCGFKAFNKDRILPILPAVRATHWFWDTELLVLAQRKNLHIKEFPVIWQEGKTTTVRVRDLFQMGFSMLSLWWRIHVGKQQ